MVEEAAEARRLAEEWEAKYKVGEGFKSWLEEADEARRLAEEWEAKYKVGKGFKGW